jgi:hypothetical protein
MSQLLALVGRYSARNDELRIALEAAASALSSASADLDLLGCQVSASDAAEAAKAAMAAYEGSDDA